jgi:hypothetical protein
VSCLAFACRRKAVEASGSRMEGDSQMPSNRECVEDPSDLGNLDGKARTEKEAGHVLVAGIQALLESSGTGAQAHH